MSYCCSVPISSNCVGYKFFPLSHLTSVQVKGLGGIYREGLEEITFSPLLKLHGLVEQLHRSWAYFLKSIIYTESWKIQKGMS